MGVDIKLTEIPQFDNLEIVKTGILTGTFGPNDLTYISVAHNLGYAPIHFVYWTNDTQTLFELLPQPSATNINTTTHVVNLQTYLSAAADSTYLYVNMWNSFNSSYTFTFRYYLFRVVAK